MIIGFTGSRTLSSNEEVRVKEILDTLNPSQVHVGDAKGVDEFIRLYYLNTYIHKADWDTYGRAAGPKRNSNLIENIDLLIAFPRSDSKGTIDCINQAKKKGIPVEIYKLD